VQTQQALIQAVRSALRSTGHAPLRDLDVEICRGVVVLWGRVPTYYQKQLAQVTAQQVEGVRAIANGLEVVCASGGPSTREQS
jgi:osmotically-inducible protein OsmY